MKVIHSERGTGKTTKLIEMSADTGFYIVCHDAREAHRVHLEAIKMGLDIPFPITYWEFLNGMYHSKGVKGVLVDNADVLIHYISKVPIGAITIRKIIDNETTGA